ncbi:MULTISPECIES: hypothetical protein [Deinococcus]|uniref:Type 4 fimbrial biogenesis protein PilX N-terminal domain-containing protein n=1 Tax=Deinococcus rufus TaxID=2136097 RepID=A0ABV7Z1C5_9DEIO|nr:hypothetical protein [Deinococcus sp. AB2017081]WQE95297.1 hypothetical protein U2P90_00005 [Deinococcus sp. AB2017081]
MKQSTGGFALVVVLSLVVVLAIVLVTYSTLTVGNVRTSASSGNASAGFYAAEAALNARAEQIRQKYRGFLVPGGTSPSATTPCKGTNLGTGDFACQSASVGGRAVTSYAKVDATQSITIPQGEDFEFLNAQETPTTVYGQAVGSTGNPEAIASLVFRSRLVPLFQFAVFFDKDLEFTNTANLTMNGPIHTNGNLFLDAGTNATLAINGQTTSSNTIYRGWKHDAKCTGTVNIADEGGTMRTLACSGTRVAPTATSMKTTYGNRLKTLPRLDVPTVAELQPRSSATYWSKADVRIVLKRTIGASNLATSTWTPYFVRVDGSPISGATCSAGLASTQTFRDNREAQYWEDPAQGNDSNRATRRLLEVNMRQLLTCLQTNRTLLSLSGLADTTEGGLVLYMTVDDTAGTGILTSALAGNTAGGSISQGGGANNYGVRLSNAALLRSTVATDPTPLGVTVVTDQALFIRGSYNSASTRANGWLPASIIADSVNVLSKDWDTQRTCQVRSGSTLFWMSRTRWAKVGTIAKVDVTGWTSTQMSATNVTKAEASSTSVMGQTWYAYNSGTYNSSYGETPAIDSATPSGGDSKSQVPLWCRNAISASDPVNTSVSSGSIVNAAILSGTSTTGSEGMLYADSLMDQSGGVHNMMRFHEDWGSNGTNPNNTVDYRYTGSLVSLNIPLHAFGDFRRGESRFYEPPRRIWAFEENFRDANNLPPLTPRFVYLKQDNFTRQFEQP